MRADSDFLSPAHFSHLRNFAPGKVTLARLSEVRAAIQESIKELGFIPDLFLIHSPLVVARADLKKNLAGSERDESYW